MDSETPRTPGRKQHTPRTIRSMRAPAREARYSACMMVGSVRALSLAMMRAGLPARACSALACDLRQQRLVQAEGRVQQLAQLRHPREPRELQEYFVDVLADGLIGGQQAVIGVEACGFRVVVAGAQVAVAPQALVLAPAPP